MLSTRVIDGLTVHRVGGPFMRDIQLQGGSQAERDQVMRDLEAILAGEPHTRTFRLALARAEMMTRRGGISIGLSREAEAVLRGKLEAATSASLAEVRSMAQKTWT